MRRPLWPQCCRLRTACWEQESSLWFGVVVLRGDGPTPEEYQQTVAALCRSQWAGLKAPCQGGLSSRPLALRKRPHPVKTAAAFCRLRRRQAGRVFPKDQARHGLSFGHGTREHPVSNTEASWTERVQGSCGFLIWLCSAGWGVSQAA